uniref:MYND-type domain-containing protein n=1 Tax=Strombidium inclinatum TaxID=197538 RepID=A0A7S3N1S5_9SPIT|mmetsp:Transcript_33414/g.51275  ORF Transcript_33414/g.51275 Transcript_33414/m.51275 type:complete len:460 (+) Transcript_33414:57-1436(+)
MIETLKQIDLKEYGSKQWFSQHENLDRLNIQAHKNAMGASDEFVMDQFVSHDKVSLLVESLLTAEVWKQKVFPLIKEDVAKISSLKSYICMYHEASICNLLEIMLYHRTACENSEDALVELIDYCYRKFVAITHKADEYEKRRDKAPEKVDPRAYLEQNAVEELEKQAEEIDLSCSMIALSLVRFITDHLESLSVPVVHQLMENNDMPCMLVPLLELKPWLRKNAKGETEKFEDQKWQVVPPSESSKLTKIEAQIWLSIYNMFLSQDGNRKYEITTFRKSNLLRLRKYLNEQLLDQLPMLTAMLRALEEMSMMGDNPIGQTNSFIVQQLPEMRVKIMRDRDWPAIAKYQMQNFFNTEVNNPKDELDSLMKLYSSDAYDNFMDDPKCACCGDGATQRCSRCKGEWYCSRECQLKQWKQHKKMCEMLSQMKQEETKRKEVQREVIKEQQEAKKKPLIEELN